MANSSAVATSPFDNPMLAVGATPPPDEGAPTGGLETATNTVRTSGDWRSALTPDRPLVWGLGLIGVTIGLIFASTSIRVGPFRAGASVGKPEEGGSS